MKRLNPSQPARRNGGATLTEVLISTMVLSIGVLSVGTLFPLSLARAIQANQLTQSTIHRYNCEALIESLKLNSYWMFVVEPGPDANSLSNFNNHFPGSFGPTAPNAGDDDLDGSPDIVNVPPNNGFTFGRDGRPGIAGIDDDATAPIDDILEIGWSNTTYVSDDQPILDADELQLGGFDTTKIVIDPLGWHRMSSTYLGTDYNGHQNNFGGDAFLIDPQFATIGGTVLPRVNGGYFANNQYRSVNPRVRPMFWNDRSIGGSPPDGSPTDELPATGGFGFTEAQAEELVTLQDQYATAIDTPFSDLAIGSITTRNRLDLTSNLTTNDLYDINQSLASGLKVRAVFFGIKGATNVTPWTETRFLLNPGASPAPVPAIPAGSIGWTDDLPAEFQIERVVLQIQNLDFTWMVTGRLTSPPPTRPQFDVVIFHNRRFEADDERLYVATQSAGNLNVVTVNFTTGNRPFARKGGWMFDVEHCIWYQIANLQETSNTLTLTLETRLRDRRDSATDNVNAVVVAFMRGIVDVFPIGTK